MDQNACVSKARSIAIFKKVTNFEVSPVFSLTESSKAMQINSFIARRMSNIWLRIFSVYNLLINTILIYFTPKNLRVFFCFPSLYPNQSTNAKSPLLRTSASAMDVHIQSKMDAGELKRVFQMFDRNGDGRITKEELSASLGSMGIAIPDVELAQMIERVDENGDGCVDADEFGALYRIVNLDRDGGDGGEEEGEMQEAFDVFDQNGDGFITVDELDSVLASLGLKQGRTVEDCKRMIMKVDADGDGMVSFNEFKMMMRSGNSCFAALV